MRLHILIDCPVTGRTPLYPSQVQPWVYTWEHDEDRAVDSMECYCLDAPAYIPTGQTRHVGTHPGAVFSQANFVSRLR